MIEFEKYFTNILDNRIVACEKMKRISEILLEQYAKPGQYHFDADVASRHTDFIERFCKLPEGGKGLAVKLELFQKARLQTIFGFVDDNDIRQYNECLIIEGRKNGKTSETAMVEIDTLENDHEDAPQIYNIATMLDQAKLGFNACYRMVQRSPLLSKHIKKRAADLYESYNMGYIKALASNTNSLDGLNVHCATIDELAAIKNRDIYDLIKQAMGARQQPLLFTISTNGFVRDGIFDSQYDYAKEILKNPNKNLHFLPFIYELDDKDEWDKEDMWIKANPGIGTIKSKDYLRQMVQKAKDDPAFKPTVMVKDFDMPETSNAGWLTWDELNNEEMFDINDFDYCIGGFDAADTTDLNAAKAIMMRPGDSKIYVKQMYWIPESVIEQRIASGNRNERDDAPYELWIKQGYMRTCPGTKCDKHIFLEWFRELKEEYDLYTMFIGYDPWHIDDTLLREFKAEFGENSMIPIRQGAITLSQPMKDMKAEFAAHNFVYNNNPVDKMCLYNTEIKTDVNANIQPVKGLDVTHRIDGSIALICAFKVLQDQKDYYINMNKEKGDNE